MSRPDAFLSRADDAPEGEAGRSVRKHLLDDPIGRAWLAVHVIDHPTRGWDSADVDFALEQAHDLLRVIGGRVGPKGDRANWPGQSSAAVAQGRVTAAQVSFVEDVLTWLSRYVGTEREAQALQLWCACIEQRRSFSGACKSLGLNPNTEKTRRRRGSLLIATGLCREDIQIPEHVLAARCSQAGAERLAEMEAAIARGPAGQGGGQALEEPAAEPDAPPELWDRCRAALANLGPHESPLRTVREIIRAQVLADVVNGETLTDAMIAAAEKRRRHLTRLARQQGLLNDGGRR
jgi:hypothetical protein